LLGVQLAAGPDDLDTKGNDLILFPNPMTKFITLGGLTDTNAFVKIIGTDGRTLIAETLKVGATTKLDKLAAGVYQYRITTDAGLNVKKLVIY
jgi:hypothetical protein